MPKTFVALASADVQLVGRGHLPVDEAEELEAGVHPGEVQLHPLLVDHPAAVEQVGRPGPLQHLAVGLIEQSR